MKAIGQAGGALVPARAALGALGLVMALASALALWGFAIDDALISIRYARNLAAGHGYRFASGGPSTDGVTPLPWPFVLAPLARADALTVLFRAKALGVTLAALTGARVGWALGATPAPRWARVATLVALALCVPVAAHAASGMETSLATLLVTLAATSRARWGPAALGGLAATLRPELLPCAVTLALLAESGRPGERGARGALAAAPFALVAVARALAFGRPVPLSVLAKPSDLAHGVAYALGAVPACLAPLAALAPRSLARPQGPEGLRGRAVVAAAVVHLGAVIAVGGDWMPHARLLVPVVPALFYAACALARPEAPRWLGLRLGATVALGVALFARTAPPSRGLHADRVRLIERGHAALAGARAVAALDVGWVSAATDAPLVDLAGLTDPEIAALPGGHTSKRVPASVLLDRGVDLVLVYAAQGGAELGRSPLSGVRVVEARLLRSELFVSRYRPREFVPLGATGAGYLVFERRP